MEAIKQRRADGQKTRPDLHHHITPKIALHTSEGIWLISWQDIVRCAADSNYTRVFLFDGTSVLVSKTLAKIEAGLPSRHFIRIHQSHLVNAGAVRCVARDGVQLQGGPSLPVSRQGRKTLLQTISIISRQI